MTIIQSDRHDAVSRRRPGQSPRLKRTIWLLVVLESALGFIGIIWMYFSSISTPAWLVPGLSTIPAIAGGLLGGALLAAVILVLTRLSPSLARLLPPEVIRLIRQLTWWQALLLSIAAGAGEEILFRGAIQPSFGIIAASILFGLVHPASLLYIIVAGMIGLLMGVVFEISGSLYMVITIHAFYDFIMIEIVRRTKLLPEISSGDRPPFPAQPEEYQ